MTEDTYRRPLNDLRISVTDRCNFRCTYCMPFDDYEWVDRSEVLTFEEIERLVRISTRLGVHKIRLTGGEPLVRAEVEDLVARLAAIPEIEDLTLTTNASLLRDKAAALAEAGLHRLNVSLDTIREETFRAITKRGDLGKVLDGLEAAKEAGFDRIKLNAVIQRGVNDGEILELVTFAHQNGFALRFIEYMDVGNANQWRSERLVPKEEILRVVNDAFPVTAVGREGGRAPAVDYTFNDGSGRIGIIASVTEPFCGTCSRARLTAEGGLVTCLFASTGFDLKALLRGGATDAEIEGAIRGIWEGRTDRYSEERWKAMHSDTGYDPHEHRKIEMIRLGG